MAAACWVTAILIVLNVSLAQAGPFFIAFFVLLAIGVKAFTLTEGLSFTISIFGVVTLALYYPTYFIEISGFELAVLITPLIQLIMFGMGSSMGVKDFVELAKAPKSVIVGVVSQFTIMPILAFILAILTNFSPEISAGIILLGCAPSSVASPVMSYLAKANVALNITIVSVTTLISPLLIPVFMKIFAGGFIAIDVLGMMWDIVQIVLLPIGAGLLFNHFLSGKAKWLDVAMPIVSMVGIALIVAIIVAAGRKSLLSIGIMLILIVLILNILGYFFGYWSGRLFNLSESNCRTIALTVGMQNAGLISGIAKMMGKIATIGLAPAICGPLMGLTSSILASYWNGNLPTKESNFSKEDNVIETVVSG